MQQPYLCSVPFLILFTPVGLQNAFVDARVAQYLEGEPEPMMMEEKQEDLLGQGKCQGDVDEEIEIGMNAVGRKIKIRRRGDGAGEGFQ